MLTLLKSRLNRYPEQANSRTGLVIVGGCCCIAGFIASVVVTAPVLAMLMCALGACLAVPSFLLGRSGFDALERIFSWLG